MNLILEKTDQVRYFTNMRDVLDASGILAQDYDWYISDIETNYYVPGLSWDDQWISGEALAAVLQHDEVQFIWAVFSAVQKGLRHIVTPSPSADGNPDYWSGKEISPQLNGAVFEIVCWDSSATILVGLPPRAEASFRKKYSDTRPLSDAARK